MKKNYKILFVLFVFLLSLIITLHKNIRIIEPRDTASASATEPKNYNEENKTEKEYDLSSLQILNGVLLNLSKCYVDPSRFNPKSMFREALYGIQDELPGLIAKFDEKNYKVEIQLGSKNKTFDYSMVDGPWSMSATMKEIFRFIKENIGQDGTTQPRNIEYAAINGMLKMLDPHTRLLPPEFYKEMKMDTEGEFGGLGIVISSPEGKLTINEVIEGTPADRKGLKCGDHIVQIGEESTINMDLEEAVSKLRGKAGTKVTVWISREGWNSPRPIEIERADIHIMSVKHQMLAGNVGYIKLSSFQENTYEDLKNALEKLRQEGMKSLILDLRNNAGGLLDQAIAVADVFLFSGTITTTRVPCSKESMNPYQAKITGTEPNYPVVVLMNRQSASASEIVAGALKNHDRALTMGERTFGKGSIQQLKEMRDGSALKYTIGEYLTPGDISIQSIGVVPDIQLIPLLIGKKETNIFVSDKDAFREDALDRHLVSDRTIQEMKPKETVEYVYYSKGEEKNVCPLPFEKIVKEDFEVKLAHDILATLTGSNRVKMLKESSNVLERARTEQNEELTRALQKFKVDWSADCTNELPPEGKLQVEFYEDGKQVDKFSFSPGGKTKIKVKVKNEWNKPLCRLYAKTRSDNKYLNKKEFIFGKVLPGKEKSWESEIELPQSAPPRIDPINFNFYVFPDIKVYSAPEIRALIKKIEYPQWQVLYEVKDDIKGDRDGIIEPNEEGRLLVHVKNSGKGKSKSMTVSIKNLSGEGVFIIKGRESIQNLASGKEATAVLKVKILGSYTKTNYKLKISVVDSDFPVYYTKEAVFPATETEKYSVLAQYDYNPVITITSFEPETGIDGNYNTSADSVRIKGIIEDNTKIEDMYVYADVDKIFYKSNEGSQTPEKMDFAVDIPLHGGINIITIFAREDSNTISMKKLIIRRDNPDGTTMPTPRRKTIEESEEEIEEGD